MRFFLATIMGIGLVSSFVGCGGGPQPSPKPEADVNAATADPSAVATPETEAPPP